MHLNQSPKDQLIVRSTIEMAHGLGFEVVAEGVENSESLTLLKQFQCNQVQGYYISKPIAADAVAEWRKNYVEEPSQMRTITRSQHSHRG
jgi:EAL domain-containing protein (putative c-di-GMP-specific phosphodiesterase class I)